MSSREGNTMTRYTPPPPLPLNSYGRAPSAPKAPAVQPPVPQPKAEPVRVVVPECTDDAPDVTTVLTDNATTKQIAATAGRFRRAAELARERSDRDQAEATRIIDQARAEAARILGEAEAAARVLTESVRKARSEAGKLDATMRTLTAAAQRAADADAAAVRAQSLIGELNGLARDGQALEDKLAKLAAQRAEAVEKLAAARDSADLDAMGALKARISSADEASAPVRTARDAVLARANEIGTGNPPESGKQPRELTAALQLAERCRRDVRRILNEAYPDRPEAVLASASEELRLTLTANLERIGEEYQAQQAEQKRPQQPGRRVIAG
jgi:hypothetical protein